MKRRIYFLFLALLSGMLATHAQELTFNRVTSPTGFSNIVGGITQDKHGFIWLATGSGLCRYDGNRFKFITVDLATLNSPGGIRLETVYADREGILWIGYWIGGLDRFDPESGELTHFRHDPKDPSSISNDTVRSILQDKEGDLWVGTSSGLDKYDPKTNRFFNYHHDPDDPSSLSCNRVRKIYEDRQGVIWIGTGSPWNGEGGETDEGGLNKFDKKTGKFTRYIADPNNPKALINNKVQGLFEDSRGIFWVGTAGDGLHTMDRRSGTFQRYLNDPKNPQKLSRPPLNNRQYTDYIMFITEDAVGGIWIGTLQNGVSRYDPKTDKIVHYSGNNEPVSGFTDHSGWSCYNSSDGMLWIGTFEGGLYRVDPYHKNIDKTIIGHQVTALEYEKGNKLWIGTFHGLLHRDLANGETKKYVYDPNNASGISSSIILSLIHDKQGSLWIGTLDGLNRYDSLTNSFIKFRNNPRDKNSIVAGNIYSIVDDGDSIWVGSNNGLDLMNKQNGGTRHFISDPKDTTKLLSDAIGTIFKDKSGNIWVGNYPGGGVSSFNRANGTFRRFLGGRTIVSMVQDNSGKIWVGTQGEGLYRGNSINNEFTKFTYPGSAIEYAFVNQIIKDDQGNIWVNTASDIFRINPSLGLTTVFGSDYGVQRGTASYFGACKGSNGKIYYGKSDGFYSFLPEELIANPTPPQVVITDFQVTGESVISGKYGIIKGPFDELKKVVLKHNQNTIAFSLTAIQFRNPENIRLLYMLEKYDNEWREGGVDRTAYYYGLPSGHYTFRTKASNSEGKWTERNIEITVSPPWWRTWWAYSIYGLLLIVAGLATHRFMRQRVITAERERSREREMAQAKEIEKAYKELGLKSKELELQKEELQTTLEHLKGTQSQLIQSEKMASLGELTAGIAHEIQNPLNFVNNFSEVNAELIEELQQERKKEIRDLENEDDILENIKENEQKISHHGKRADGIVKGMLQHSRTSSGVKEPTDINVLADEYLRLSYHGLRAKDKTFNATMKTELDSSIGNIQIIPQDIGRVLLNLYNNAFYAITEKKKQLGDGYEPTLSVTTSRENGRIAINVKDNGNGIPKEVRDKIFQPFFTTKPTGTGTGLGLSLAYDIVKAHGGELKVNTKEGQGTEFIIELPIN